MSDQNAQSEISTILNALEDGLRKKDASAIVNLYTPDAVLFDLAPPLARRIDKDQLDAWLNTWEGPVESESRDTQIVVRGDLAFCYGLIHVSARTRGGEQAAWWMRATSCLIRQDGAWKIVHEHTSVPFHMDGSFRAAVDLEP
jgi:ketosteroid isomerase-like protein